MTVVRTNRFKNMDKMLEEARSDASLAKANNLRILQSLTERDQAQHEERLARAMADERMDHLRVVVAAIIARLGGAFELSHEEQEAAYQRANQVEIHPSPDSGPVRFSLNETIPLRELPKKPAPPVEDTPDTPAEGQTAAATDEAPEPGAAEATGSSTEPLPS